MVLFRVTGEVEGKPLDILNANHLDLSGCRKVKFRFGGFDTLGEIKHVRTYQSISDESRRQGWVYFLLEPEIIYFTVRPPLEFQRCVDTEDQFLPKWRIDIPKGVPLVYAGTLHFKGESVKGIFGIKSISFWYGRLLRNEENLAQEFAAKHLADLGLPKTELMQRHVGVMTIVRTPNRSKRTIRVLKKGFRR